MARQYIIFSALLLLGFFLFTKLEWDTSPIDHAYQVRKDNPAGDNSSPDHSDLRTGNASDRWMSVEPPTKANQSPEIAIQSKSVAPTNTTRTAQATMSVDVGAALEDGHGQKDTAHYTSTLHIAGNVIDSLGEWVVGMPMTLNLIHASEADKAIFGVKNRSSQTNAAGHYTFRNLVAGDYEICTETSLSYIRTCLRTHSPFLTADFALIAITKGQVSGFIIDQQNQPLSGVIVTAEPHQKAQTKTDQQGQFELPMFVNESTDYQVHFNKKGYGSTLIRLPGTAILQQQKVGTQMRALGGFEVTGQVLDQHHQPVSGVGIRFYSPTAKNEATISSPSNAIGEFAIQNIPAASDYNLSITGRGKYTLDATNKLRISIYENMPGLKVYVTSKASTQGSYHARVTSPSDGLPLAGVEFELSADGLYTDHQTTGANGDLHFSAIPIKYGGSSISISSQNNTPDYSFGNISLAQSAQGAGNLIVSKGPYALTVMITDEVKAPIKGARARVIWRHKRDGIIHITTRSGKVSPPTGIVKFSGMTAGKHQLSITNPGYKNYRENVDITQLNQTHLVKLKKH